MCISRWEHLQERKQKAQRREHSGPLANRKASVTAVCSYFYLYLVILTVQRRFLDETSNHLLTEKTVYFLFLNSLWGRAAGLGENQVYLVGPGGKGLWTTRKETPNHKIQFSFFPLGSGGWRERGKQRERENSKETFALKSKQIFPKRRKASGLATLRCEGMPQGGMSLYPPKGLYL